MEATAFVSSISGIKAMRDTASNNENETEVFKAEVSTTNGGKTSRLLGFRYTPEANASYET